MSLAGGRAPSALAEGAPAVRAELSVQPRQGVVLVEAGPRRFRELLVTRCGFEACRRPHLDGVVVAEVSTPVGSGSTVATSPRGEIAAALLRWQTATRLANPASLFIRSARAWRKKPPTSSSRVSSAQSSGLGCPRPAECAGCVSNMPALLPAIRVAPARGGDGPTSAAAPASCLSDFQSS